VNGCGGGCGCGHVANESSRPVPLELRTRSTPPPWYHLINSDPPLAFIVDSSALFEVPPDLFADLERRGSSAEAELAAFRKGDPTLHSLGNLPRPRAISLNVAQSCNMTCTYCYADEGRFGGAPRRMAPAVAHAAVDELISGTPTGDSVLVGFIGGEPLLNRTVLHDCVAYTNAAAAAAGVHARFSITTNGSLIEPVDVELFRTNRFAVTVSVDGGQETHDRHRRRRDGSGSWQHTIDRLRDLLSRPGHASVSARATVTRDDLDIAGIVDDLGAAGFAEIGVSPVRSGPDASLVLAGSDWQGYLDGLIDAASAELARLDRDGPARGWRFTNFGQALTEIHRGTARPLPCGAAYGYLSVDVDGRYSTCHRTVGDERFELGSIGALSDQARIDFLQARLVDTQEPCRSCWARYLCGGGCHAEVSQVGRHGCDMIRGWLDFCLTKYLDVYAAFPELFATAPAAERSIHDG
jgi:uncharacterized protein